MDLAWNLIPARAVGWGRGRSWGFWAWLLCAQAGSAFQRTAPELGPSDFSKGSHQVGGEAALRNPWPWEGPLPFPPPHPVCSLLWLSLAVSVAAAFLPRTGAPTLAPWWLQQHLCEDCAPQGGWHRSLTAPLLPPRACAPGLCSPWPESSGPRPLPLWLESEINVSRHSGLPPS